MKRTGPVPLNSGNIESISACSMRRPALHFLLLQQTQRSSKNRKHATSFANAAEPDLFMCRPVFEDTISSELSSYDWQPAMQLAACSQYACFGPDSQQVKLELDCTGRAARIWPDGEANFFPHGEIGQSIYESPSALVRHDTLPLALEPRATPTVAGNITKRTSCNAMVRWQHAAQGLACRRSSDSGISNQHIHHQLNLLQFLQADVSKGWPCEPPLRCGIKEDDPGPSGHHSFAPMLPLSLQAAIAHLLPTVPQARTCAVQMTFIAKLCTWLISIFEKHALFTTQMDDSHTLCLLLDAFAGESLRRSATAMRSWITFDI